MDKAISAAARQIESGLDGGSTVIVYQFQSDNEHLSAYILNELFDRLVNSRQFTVLDRSSQKLIDDEIDFQHRQSAGMISDDSLASLTKRLGAQAIVSGSLDDTGADYRFRVRVIGTETTEAIVSYVAIVAKKDRRITAFLSPPSGPGVGHKLGTGAANMFFGLGSYREGDLAGGLTITSGYTAAIGLCVLEATALDWDSSFVGVPATIGVTTAGLTLVYGFIRPFIYKRSPQTAAVLDAVRPHIVMAPDTKTVGFQLSYTIRF